MPNDLATIQKLKKELQTVREDVKLVGDSITDQEAITALKRARPDWIPGRLVTTSERQERLWQTLSFLDEGLKNHFALEEKILPPLLGEFLMRALVTQHREIRKEYLQKTKIKEKV